MNFVKHIYWPLIAFLMFVGCASDQNSSGNGCLGNNKDNGRIIRNNVELRPLYMPFEIVVERSMLASQHGQSGLFHESAIREAMQWWHEKTRRRDLFRLRIVDNYNRNYSGELSPSWGQVYLRIETATNVDSEDMQGRGGITTLGFNKTTGVIYLAIVSINVVMTRHLVHERNVLIHEFGHILGLDDDPIGINNRSAMRSKLVLTEDIMLTEKDKELVAQL